MQLKKRNIIAILMTTCLLVILNFLWLNKFQPEILIIILILGYLLSYKLVDYIADFKTVKEQSRIDILFLVAFFIILFLPMMHIDKSNISKSENRKLAKWKPLITSHKKINYQFGHDFGEWFNDRFFLRKPVIKSYSRFKYGIAINYYENSKGFVNKKNKWLTKKYNLKNFQITHKEKILIINNLNKLKKYCNKRGIKPYIIIVPRKEEICVKELYPILKDVNKYSQTSEFIDYIKEKTGIEIVYPYKEIKNLQNSDIAYFKTDHHWTDEGAYLGYLKLMEKIKKDFPDIKISQADDFDYKYSKKVRVSPKIGYFEGITYKNLNIHDKKLLDTKYKYFYPKNKIEYKNPYAKKYHIYEYFQDINAPNAVILGDSFSLNLLPILPSSFRNTVSIYATIYDIQELSLKKRKNYVLKNNPKVLIYCFSEIIRLKYMFREEE